MCLVGCTGYFLFGVLNRTLTLAVSGGMVNVMLVIGALLVSYLYFGESLSPKQIVGIVLACAAIVLMS
jgi:drug/metabolite transporter (DMT)-like permease